MRAFGHFPKRDNELDGGVYTFKTEPDGWIAVSLVYIGSSRPTGGGDCGAEGMGHAIRDMVALWKELLQLHFLKMLMLGIIPITFHNND